MFSLILRATLIIVSLGLIVFLLRSIKKSKMRIEDALFWVFFSLLILLLSIFPEIASFFSNLLGFQAPVNFIFLFFIFVLIVRDFYSNRRISQLENRIKELTQQIAIDRLGHYERKSENLHGENDTDRDSTR